MESGTIDPKIIDEKIQLIQSKLMDLGNLSGVALAFGVAFTKDIFNRELAVLGAGIVIISYALAWFLRSESIKRKRR